MTAPITAITVAILIASRLVDALYRRPDHWIELRETVDKVAATVGPVLRRVAIRRGKPNRLQCVARGVNAVSYQVGR